MSDSLLGEVLKIGEDVAAKNYAGALSELEAAGLAYFEAQPLYTLAVDASIKIRAFNHTFGSITFVKKTFQIPMPTAVFALLTKIHGDTLVNEDAHGFTLVVSLSPSAAVATVEGDTTKAVVAASKKGYDATQPAETVKQNNNTGNGPALQEVKPAPAESFPHPTGDVPSETVAEGSPAVAVPVVPEMPAAGPDTSESGAPPAQPADLVGFQPS